MEKTEPQTVIYKGPSMNPTLKPGDRLFITPCDGRKIQRGDVVVFTPPGADYKVIHRAVSFEPQGIKTRGDNNNQVDPWLLRHDQILGRVFSAERGKRRRRIFGGAIGQLFGVAIRAVHSIDASVSSRFRPAYDRLAVAGVFRRWLPGWMKTKAISLSHPAGMELQLLMGRRVIGRWLPGKSGWNIRRPFRLFVDEESLPENKAGVSGFRCQEKNKAKISDASKNI
ncbi:MAG: signal peptidase I [Syntrophobacterales bacterium]|jgi:signal peptidase I